LPAERHCQLPNSLTSCCQTRKDRRTTHPRPPVAPLWIDLGFDREPADGEMRVERRGVSPRAVSFAVKSLAACIPVARARPAFTAFAPSQDRPGCKPRCEEGVP